MKKCPKCDKEIDKYGIACQYCGILVDKEEAIKKSNKSKDKPRKVREFPSE